MGPSTKSEREVQKIADEHLRPLNQGLETIGGAVNFNTFVEQHFLPLMMPQYAETTKDRYQGILGQYLMPAFGISACGI